MPTDRNDYDDRHYHYHRTYYDTDDWFEDWPISFMFFFLVFFLCALSCFLYMPCGNCGNCWQGHDEEYVCRPVVRYKILKPVTEASDKGETTRV